ncbi:unnamed protein product [Ranitomeya imitator]|uniref:Uncharacterized protein n=1 Tax=Ranitomeya imitator TaxID=111125 RepID=A0ABN9KQ50_9NEOB|nr:unnamed protein product [Ranitomeya imitator]
MAKMTCNLAAPRNTLLSTLLHLEMAKVSSTPKRIITEPKPIWDKNCDSSMKASAFDDDLMQNCEIISGLKETQSVATQTEPCVGLRTVEVVNATTQTNVSTPSTAGTQTAVLARVASTQTIVLARSTTTQTASTSGTSAGSTQNTSNSSTSRLSSSSFTSLSSSSSASSTGSSTSGRSFDITGSNLNLSDYPMRDSFQKLTKERQYHYTSIRSKLDHMVSILSRRSRLANTFMTCAPTGYGLQRSVYAQ